MQSPTRSRRLRRLCRHSDAAEGPDWCCRQKVPASPGSPEHLADVKITSHIFKPRYDLPANKMGLTRHGTTYRSLLQGPVRLYGVNWKTDPSMGHPPTSNENERYRKLS